MTDSANSALPQCPPYGWNDTEYAVVVPPWETCCSSSGDNCVCITSGDVQIFDDLYNTVSGNSASWFSAGYLVNSAALWNSNFETVSSNSANWNSAYALSKAMADLSATWNYAYSSYSSYSGFLNTYSGISAIITDDSLSGIGNKEYPLGLNKFLVSKIDTTYDLVTTSAFNYVDGVYERNFLNNEEGNIIFNNFSAWNETVGLLKNEIRELWAVIHGAGGLTYIPGKYISISGATISVSGLEPYSAGSGLTIENNIISTSARGNTIFQYENSLSTNNYSSFNNENIIYYNF